MADMRFRCIAKSSSENGEGEITFTIRFRRAVSSGNGIEIGAKIKTTSREVADRYLEGEEYTFKIREDDELGGVFAAANRQEEPPRAPLMTEERLRDYVARIATSMHEKEPQVPLDELIRRVATTVWPVKDGNVEELSEKARPYVLRALAGIREDAFGALVEMETFTALGEKDLTDDELFAAVLVAVGGYQKEGEQDEFEAKVRPLVEQAAERFWAEQFRQEVRQKAEELLAGIEPRPEIDNLVETILADGDLFPDEPTDEERTMVRQEVELIYARLAAKEAGEEKPEETYEQRVTRLTRKAMDEYPDDADDAVALAEWVFMEYYPGDNEGADYAAALEAEKPKLLPIVQAAVDAYRAEKEQTREQETALAEDGKEYDEGLRCALHMTAGAKERWAALRETGATDEQILDQIREEFGDQGGGSVPGGMHQEYKGGKNPRFWYGEPGSITTAAPPTLKGKELVREVRRVMRIPYPQETPAAATGTENF
ncbi:MAG: hypothetical protein ACM3ZC_13580 [Bacteroidota bacterium]